MPRHQKRKKPNSDRLSVHETVNKMRKKSKDESIHVSVQQQKSVTTMSKASVDQTKVSSKGNVTTAFSGSFDDDDELSYTAVARIRAAFYPKFDNEMPEQKVRKRMVKLVSEGLAALEVSLKHSGSLFMYAGHEGGAYAKNSYGNIYTAVGVFVLHRTFQQAWGLLAEKKQQEFNEFLERNRMCISMELVTAVLGDHGQRPRKDYVVVTAVTELGTGKPKFYSAPDIIVFCRKWRLPTNHVWLFTTRKSVKSFFAAYDALNEEGTATPVCKALDEIADISVSGSIDHIEMQGEILEGLVARIVSHKSLKQMKQASKDYPLVPLKGDCTSTGHHLGPSLREIFSANKTGDKQRMKAVLESVGSSFCPNYVDWFGDEYSSSSSTDVDRSAVSKFTQAHPADFSTRKLQEMIRLTQEKRIGVAKCYRNFHKIDSVAEDNLNFKMVIHLHNDQDFMKYHNEMSKDGNLQNKPGLWPLYRGFFLDINLFMADKESVLDYSEVMNVGQETGSNMNGEFAKDGLDEEDANLMLKLKFLPYMLRTFLMRNSLPFLFDEGEEKYKQVCKSKMEKWNTSKAKIRDVIEMLDKWAVYICVKHGHKKPDTQTYLNDAEPFLENYAKRSAKHQALIGSAGSLVRAEKLLTTIEKDEGLIVFFPGIPGCGKSALCEEILKSPEVLGDGRVILSLMGDRVKENYWGTVSEKRRKDPCSIFLADKNAPDRQIWKKIEKLCDKTTATAIPVVPDSEGTESNPYSLDALAVFMFRVLRRTNHPGNLDESSSVAGSVLLMFYHLYDGMSRNAFETDLLSRFGSLVKMPLLKPNRPPLPERVRSTLVKGINLYKQCTGKNKRDNRFKKFMEGNLYVEELVEWEKLLRKTLLENFEYLNSIQVPFELSVQRVVEQLKVILKGKLTPPPSTKKPKFASIVFAAVNLLVAEIICLLDNLGAKDPNVLRFLRKSNMKNTFQKAHVTLAHIGSHGVTGVASYAHYHHEKVPVHISALLFSDKLAALEVDLGHVDGEKVSSKIEWPHVTLWTAKGISPREASKLPHLFAEGKATRVKIDSPVTITGTLEFC